MVIKNNQSLDWLGPWTFRVCWSNLIVKDLHIPNFIRISAQLIFKNSKIEFYVVQCEHN
jgi:hypothetical protein